MKRAKRSLAILMLTALLVSLLAGCSQQAASGDPTPQGSDNAASQGSDAAQSGSTAGNTEQAEQTGTPKDEIVVLLPEEPTSLDPAMMNTTPQGNVGNFVMDGLWELHYDGTYESQLLESWELVDDVTLKLQLKDDLKFSDGTEVTSEDILWNYQRASESSVSKSQFALFDAEGSEIIDDKNLIVKFKQPWSVFVDTLSSVRGNIQSKQHFETVGEAEASRQPVGAGPYKIAEWVSGISITLEANEYYWGDGPLTPKITMKFVKEASSRVIELETGAADIAYNISTTDIQRVDELDGYHIEKGDSLRYFLITLSMQEPLFQDKNVRYAMSYAIDKEALVRACTDGVGTVINTMGPPLAIEGMLEMPEIPYDVEQAKKLMADAGYADGFTIDLHVVEDALFQRLAEAVQAMWQEIGITTNIVVAPLATYDAQHNGMFQACIRDGNAKDISNIWSIYESSFGSRLNGNDAHLDELLNQIKAHYQGDPDREALLEEAANYLYDIRFSIPFMTMPALYGVSDKLEGFVFHHTTYCLDPSQWVVYE